MVTMRVLTQKEPEKDPCESDAWALEVYHAFSRKSYCNGGAVHLALQHHDKVPFFGWRFWGVREIGIMYLQVTGRCSFIHYQKS